MAWVVDTSVLVDVYLADPQFAAASAQCLKNHLPDGLVVCPVSYVELFPACRGKETVLQSFLQQLGVQGHEPWIWADTQKAGTLWNQHVIRKKKALTGKRPLGDVLIGAYAYRFQGLITRNQVDFRNLCPGLTLVSP